MKKMASKKRNHTKDSDDDGIGSVLNEFAHRHNLSQSAGQSVGAI